MKNGTSNNFSSFDNFELLSFYMVVPTGLLIAISNIYIAVIIKKSKELKDPTYIMIASLTGFDALGAIQFILTFGAPIFFWDGSNFFAADLFCKLMYYILCSILGTSINIFTGISFYRYWIVSKASRTRSKKREIIIIKRYVYISCIISWLCNIPGVFFTGSNVVSNGFCDVSYIKGIEYSTFAYYSAMTIIMYVLPAAIIIINYSRLMNKLRNYVTPFNGQSLVERAQLRNRRVLEMLMIITGIFLLSSCFIYVLLLYVSVNVTNFYDLYNSNETWHAVLAISFPLFYVSNVINPIIYIVYDKNIRQTVILNLRLSSLFQITRSSNQSHSNPQLSHPG